MKRLFFVLAVILIGFIAGMLVFKTQPRQTNSPNFTSNGSENRSADNRFKLAAKPKQTPASSPIQTAVSSLAAELNSPNHPPERDLEIIHALLRQYLKRLHNRQGHPIGDDIDLVEVLTGRNPMHQVILPPNHPAISSDGHLRDRWGTPYFVHPRGNNFFEIRSAGPDKKLFTSDDIIEAPVADVPDALQ